MGCTCLNPHGLIDCFVANGFKIVYLKYSTDKGKAVSDHRNLLLWLVGKKEKELPVFACPQPTIWATDYYQQIAPSENSQSGLTRAS